MVEETAARDVLGPLDRMWASLVSYLPSLVGGLLILMVGIVICWFVKGAVARLAMLLRVDRLLAVGRWKRGLEREDVRQVLAGTLGTVVAACVFLVFLDNAVLVWKLEVPARLIGSLVDYLPKLIVGGLVLAVGMFIAALTSGIVQAGLAAEGFARAALAGRLARWGLSIVVAFIALEELAIAPRTVATAFKIGFGSLALTLALSVGLGSRDAVERLWRQLLEPPDGRREPGP